MGSVRTMMGAGLPAASAVAIHAGTVAPAVTAAGTTNADATQLVADSNVVTTGVTNAGVKLPDVEVGSCIVVINGTTAAPLLVYPGTGLQMNNKTATTGTFNMGANEAAIFIRLTAVHWAGLGDTAA